LTVGLEMKSHLGISEARARLPELAKRLAAMPGRVEYISHRDHYRALELPGSLAGWIDGLRHSASYIVHDLTAEVVLASNDLYEIPERGDRLIAATAAHLGVPLITRDPGIAGAAAVPLIW
jgi:predicted nucleic acid-binding protein